MTARSRLEGDRRDPVAGDTATHVPHADTSDAIFQGKGNMYTILGDKSLIRFNDSFSSTEIMQH